MIPDKVRSRIRTITRQRGRAHDTIPERCSGCPSRKRTLRTTAWRRAPQSASSGAGHPTPPREGWSV